MVGDDKTDVLSHNKEKNMKNAITSPKTAEKKKTFSFRVKRDFKKNWQLYLLVVPIIIYYLIFHFKPMVGASIAFMDYNPFAGYAGSEWVGLKHFKAFFSSPDFYHVLRNTLKISISTIIFSFPLPIILAIFINELRSDCFSKTVKTISYLPHFISLVVICGLIKTLVSSDGLIGNIVGSLTGNHINLLDDPKAFVKIYVTSEIWQNMGWDSIIYIAALAGVDQQLYEAASVDGCGRFRKMINITLPSIMPTIIIMLILKLGGMLAVGYEKIILLYNPLTYDTADVISSYVYRRGLQEFNYSFSTAVGLFNSVINFILVVVVNWISKRASDVGIM